MLLRNNGYICSLLLVMMIMMINPTIVNSAQVCSECSLCSNCFVVYHTVSLRSGGGHEVRTLVTRSTLHWALIRTADLWAILSVWLWSYQHKMITRYHIWTTHNFCSSHRHHSTLICWEKLSCARESPWLQECFVLKVEICFVYMFTHINASYS